MLTFVVPSPPSANNLFANVPGRGRVRSARYRAWAEAAGWAMKTEGGRARAWETISAPVEVEIVNGNTRGDIDNGIKALLDLLVDMQVIADDSRVVSLRVSRGGKPREAIVTVRSAPLVIGLAAPLREYDAEADAAGSYYAAIEEIGRRVKAGEEPVPTTGYFGARKP